MAVAPPDIGACRLDAGEQVAVGVAEGAYSFALELGRDGGEIDARILGAAERLLRRPRAEIERARSHAVVSEGAKRGRGHGVMTSGAIRSST